MNILLQELALVIGMMTQSGVDLPPEDVTCLARTVYHEARGESLNGQRAVAHVVINRVTSNRFPNDICSVVEQPLHDSGCQFSYFCDGVSDTPNDDDAYAQSVKIAIEVMSGISADMTGGATFFVARGSETPWHNKLKATGVIGEHSFYRRKAAVVGGPS